MAQRATVDDEEEELELTPDMELDEGPDDEPDEGESEGEGVSGDEGEEDEETVVSFDDDEAGDEPGNSTIRQLRDRNKELAKENADLRRSAPQPPQIELGPKPAMTDFDFDEEKFEAALTGWHERKRQIEQRDREAKEIADAAEREWQRDMANFNTRRDALSLPDYDEAAEHVGSTLALPQQAVIIKVARDAPAFIYGLSKSDTRLMELAKIQDPIKLAAAVARMEGGLKVVKRRKGAAPDRPAKGSRSMPGGVDKRLEQLETEANRTGNRTELIAYRKKLEKRAK